MFFFLPLSLNSLPQGERGLEEEIFNMIVPSPLMGEGQGEGDTLVRNTSF